MKYIMLDLEWNQAYVQKAIAVQKRLSARLRGEVIQIGAVMMDEDLSLCGSFSVIVKPQYFCKIHRHVRDLTGITQEKMDKGAHISDAIVKFKDWCGEDFAFFTWGPDDIPMLKENLAVHGIESSWLDRVYDLQTIFNAQTDKSKQQRSLEYAMEHFEIEQTLPSHDALNDAYFTALVAQKLDMKLGISSYRGSDEEFLFDQTYGDSNIGEDGYVEISEFFEEEKSELHECPICKKEVKHENKSLHCKGHRYVTLYSCPEHGELFLQIKMYKNFDESWRARKTVAQAKEEDIAEYIRRLDENEERKKRRRKAKKASRSAKKTEKSAEKEALPV
ncbi:MAG: exonuclease domain-containing protein [Clostridia bacterium]|nr:exonuclease domain-containing protein [Clostridia bacterium]MBQ5800661.1 exonuclease domain-containing protein [Clostridia bacterium]